ncbi:MAG: hypothetical protein NTZ11_01220 [Gammaproteobacteria bacterium]|nr:hypothetical protein [Gammaproteobacteria bacterium]
MKTFLWPADLRSVGDRLLWIAGWINLLMAAVMIAALSTIADGQP